ncbi:BapA prefix-like domain-containing protein [Diaphorobacter sp. NR2-3-3-1]|nr:BapA prefix-like domain-containing protein [Diaphorobacter caeni]
MDIVVISKKSAVSKYGMPAEFRLSDASVVQVGVTRADVKEMIRNGKDLIIQLHNGEVITVQDFFAQLEGGQSNLVLEDDQEGLWLASFGEGEGALGYSYSNLYSIEPLLAESDNAAVPLVLTWAAGMAALLAVGSSIGGSDSSQPVKLPLPEIHPVNGKDPITGVATAGSTVTVTFPDGTTATATAGADGKYSVPNPGLKDGDIVSVVATDSSGGVSDPAVATVDAVAPNAPTMDPVNGHDAITGHAEPGSTVTVKFPDGSTTTAQVGEDGTFSVANPGLGDGDRITATATDAAGNTSGEATATVDAIAPPTPTVDPANAKDPITGTAEPGSTVTVKFPDGSTATATAGADGGFVLPNPGGLDDGDKITVTATDSSGNTSGEASVTIDAIAPNVPTVNTVTPDEPITGKAEPDSTVTVTFPDGSTATVTTGKDGSFEVPNAGGLEDGEKITVTATDPAGNTSGEATATVDGGTPEQPPVDTSAPAVPDMDLVNGKDPITGTAEPGSTVTVTYPDGTKDSVTAGPDGSFTIPNPGDLTDGDKITATATDPSGNVSDEATATVDAVAPPAPTVDPVGPTQPITGEAEPGATVTVTYPDGTKDSVTAGPDGSFEVPNPGNLTDGGIVTVIATDPAGNVSGETQATVDGVAPTLTITDDVAGTLGQNGVVTFTFTFSEEVEGFDASDIAVSGGDAGQFTQISPGVYTLRVTPHEGDAGTIIVSVSAGAAHDLAGNPNTAASASQASDTVAPPDGSLGGLVLEDNVGDDQSPILAGETTDDSTPTYTGTAAAGVATVELLDNGVVIGTATVNADGTFSVAPGTPITGTDHSFTLRPVDAAGNAGAETGEIAFTFDGVAPAAPSITDVSANDTGALKNIQKDAVTSDNTPVLSGTGTAGTTVTVYDGSTAVGSAVVDPQGHWSVEVSALGEGSHSLTATSTNAASVESAPTGAYPLVVDTVAPATPAAPVATDNVNTPGVITAGGTTDDATPTLSGTGQPGETVTIMDNGAPIGTATVQPDGTWSFTPAQELAEGSHSLTSTLTDAAGNTSAPSPALDFTVDTSTLELTISSVQDDVQAITGAIADGGTTNDSTPTFAGKANAGQLVTIHEGTTAVASVVADATGHWSVSLPVQAEGTHSYVASSTNAANVTATASFTLTVDTQASSVPAIGKAVDDVGSHQGDLVSGGVTDDTTPTLSGTGTAGDLVNVYVDGTLVGSTTVQPDGSWSYTAPALTADGEHQFTTTSVDAAGNESAPGTPFVVNLDTTAPDMSAVTLTVNPVTADNVVNAAEAQSAAVTLTGTLVGVPADVTATSVQVSLNGATYEATVTGTTWSVSVPGAALAADADKTLQVTATMADAAGNEGVKTAAQTYTVDTSVSGIWLDAPIEGDNIVNAAEVSDVVVSGTTANIANGLTVNVTFTDGVNSVNAVATINNNAWTAAPADLSTLNEGTITVTAQVTDQLGNPASAQALVKLDTVPPSNTAEYQIEITAYEDNVTPNDGDFGNNTTTNDPSPLLKGSVAGLVSGDVVRIYEGATLLGEATVASGAWTFQLNALTAGAHSYTAVIVDEAGNKGLTSNVFTLTEDSSASTSAPTIISYTDDQGTLQSDYGNATVTDDTAPVLNGSIPAALGAGEQVLVYRIVGSDSVLVGEASVNATDNSWHLQLSGLVDATTYQYVAKVVDAAGNVGPLSNTFSLTVDTNAPSVMVTIDSYVDDAGSVVNNAMDSGTTTDDTSPLLRGTLQYGLSVGDSVQIYQGNTLLGTATVMGTGWTYQLHDLADATYNYTALVVDQAGNASTTGKSPVFTLTVNTSAPEVTTTIDTYSDNVGALQGNYASGTTTDDTTPVLNGSLSAAIAAGETVRIYQGTTLLGNATVDAAGTGWTYALSGLANGQSYSYTAVVTSDSGAEGSASTAFTLSVDTVAPTTTTTILYNDNVGAAQGDFGTGTTTDDRTPLLKGALSTALAANETVDIYEGTTLLGHATVTGNNWTFVLPDQLADNSTHTYVAKVVDAAGNQGANASLTINVDLVVVVQAQNTLDTTPIIAGSVGFEIQPGEYVQVTVNGVTYSSQTGAVVVDPLNNTWYVQIPDANALTVRTYDVTAVLYGADGVAITSDATTNELVVAPTPVVTVGAGGGDSNQKATAVTLSEDGLWRIHSNQTMLDSTATSSSSLGDFSTTKLVSNSGAGYSGASYVQNATFIDYNRDGYMDLFAVDSVYDDGQQMFYYNGSTYAAYQVGAFTTSPQTGSFAGDANTAGSANTWSWYGGIVAIDKNGDGYVDMVIGDQTPNDTDIRGGYGSQIVLNNDGTVTGMSKDGAFANSYAIGAAGYQAPTAQNQSQPDMELSGVDINNDGVVDFVMHSQNIVAPNGSVVNASGANSTNNARLVVVNGTNTGAWNVSQIVENVFQRGDDSDPAIGNGVAMTWADFNGDGYMDLFLGRGSESTSSPSGAANSNAEYASRIYMNDGTGKLVFSDANGDGVGTPTAAGMYTFGDTLAGGASIALDWNHDGKMDVIELPGMAGGIAIGISAAAQTGPINLYTNTTTGTATSFATTNLLTQVGTSTIGSSANPVTGAVAIDIDWDGDRDLLAFTQQGKTTYIENKNQVADGTSLHFRILDKGGINSLYGNTVQLVNEATGAVVGTQTINPQSGNQTNDSTAIVDFYGLDASATYSVVILRSESGAAADVGGVSSVGSNTVEIVNSSWGGISAGAANSAYVLTTESATASNNANVGNGIVGSGYNDTFMATQGTDIFTGGGGTTEISGVKSWSDTGGLDIVDYKAAGSAAIQVNLSLATAQNTGFGTHTFREIEGIAGASGNDTFTDNAGNNYFDGRGGNDTFNLTNGGNDTLMYKLLNANNATGGNGSDVVNGFKVGTWEATANADRIDVSDLLVGYTPTVDGQFASKYINGVATINAGDNIAQYLSVTTSGGNTMVSIDRDGAGGTFSSTTLVTLTGVETDLATLLANHQISLI